MVVPSVPGEGDGWRPNARLLIKSIWRKCLICCPLNLKMSDIFNVLKCSTDDKLSKLFRNTARCIQWRRDRTNQQRNLPFFHDVAEDKSL